ncbi:MAG: iron ABC transporter permease [Actinomycetaceae bacterium]|nr:iron ABC transporter permease [Actinomycetaceae bacterium]
MRSVRAGTMTLGICILTLLLVCASLFVGPGRVSVFDVLSYLAGHGEGEHLALVVGRLRLPRALAIIEVGACLGIAGSLLQSLTRNPLADTGLLGVNSGAGLGVVVGQLLAPSRPFGALAYSLAGACASGGVLLCLLRARRRPSSSVTVVLAGVGLAATLGGLTQLTLVMRPDMYDHYRWWILGSLVGVEPDEAASMGLVAGLALAALAALRGRVAVMGLDDETSLSLGYRPAVTRALVVGLITLCAATAVAIAGPLSFLGLIAAFAGRHLWPSEPHRQAVAAGAIGAGVLAASDIAARLVIPGYELSVGVVVALLGAPILLWLARRPAGARL